MSRAKPVSFYLALLVVFHPKPVRLLSKPRAGRHGAEGGDHVAVHIENLDHRVRGKLIASGSEFHGSGNFLRSDESVGRVVAIERDCERVSCQLRPCSLFSLSCFGSA
jgi:hypothetical protein